MSIKEEAQEYAIEEGSCVLSVTLELCEGDAFTDPSGIEICLNCAEKRNLSREWRTDRIPFNGDHYSFWTEDDHSYQLKTYCNDCGVFLGGHTLEEMGYR